jgi:hypothetical protein
MRLERCDKLDRVPLVELQVVVRDKVNDTAGFIAIHTADGIALKRASP